MSFLPGLVIGGLVGAAVAWLSTPRTGQENRELLVERGTEMSGRVDELLPGAREIVRERARLLLDEQRERFQHAAEEARAAAERARQELMERYQSAKRGE